MIDAADIGRVNDVRFAIITLFTSCTVIDTYCGYIIVSLCKEITDQRTKS